MKSRPKKTALLVGSSGSGSPVMGFVVFHSPFSSFSHLKGAWHRADRAITWVRKASTISFSSQKMIKSSNQSRMIPISFPSRTSGTQHGGVSRSRSDQSMSIHHQNTNSGIPVPKPGIPP